MVFGPGPKYWYSCLDSKCDYKELCFANDDREAFRIPEKKCPKCGEKLIVQSIICDGPFLDEDKDIKY